MLCIFLSVQQTRYGAASVTETQCGDMSCPLSVDGSATVTHLSSSVVIFMNRD